MSSVASVVDEAIGVSNCSETVVTERSPAKMSEVALRPLVLVDANATASPPNMPTATRYVIHGGAGAWMCSVGHGCLCDG